jgi:hypothetical protein
LAQPKLTRQTKPALAAAVTIIGALLAGCGYGGGADGITGKSIRYQVEYSGSPQTGITHRAISIVYATNEGLLEQDNVGLPWTKVVGSASPGFNASVKAQFYGFGTIICRILADDKLIQNKSSGEEPYPSVECST